MLKFVYTKHLATSLGLSALLMWGFGALLVAKLANIPRFEIVAITFAVSCILSIVKISYKKSWSLIAQTPKKLWIITFIGIYCANLCFVYAMQLAPPEKVDLINYIWPVFAIIFSPLISKLRINILHVVGILVAFSGIYILVTDGKGISGFEFYYWPGYLLACLNALFWSCYVLLSRRYQEAQSEIIGLCCGVGAICSLIFHFVFESFVVPTLEQLLMMLSLGLMGQGLAYLFWDKGIKYGQYYLLCACSYFTPILSIALLIQFDLAKSSFALYIATLLVSIGALLVTQHFADLLKYLANKTSQLFRTLQNYGQVRKSYYSQSN